ncbi:MAG: Preprotein translocase, SecG subunit [Candidatus Jorgensenbacteria bacterium GW2011_GWA1_48_13]|uniref:Protein-export membrane protein SecG n=2 Tax=Candidatus Joergenseniibacteriota TaxID=1752739 RepID=A0A0G1W9S5_9BACT|nr:MAG: Preprotein translocase, SecG subunit [Candidatus Jorgensenbacteria bacterium GW2011_GWA1_48_13]KKU98826.1 MAG: Preprotein translocase, SecG subunit [Candidatus Jorgensenbacteria bacterium GW2011_GWC1_48_8]KKW15340.1 MAG: Preprotein translocase, SecG subunit [Candidatus Jorgensenbacteria bacterium GW2011_GWB1_50_10]
MLLIAQIAISVILIVLVLIQERSQGLGGLFGGGGSATPYYTRRGLEKMVYWGTIVAALLFVALALTNLFITK